MVYMDNSGQTFALRVCRSLLCGVCGGGDVVCRVQCAYKCVGGDVVCRVQCAYKWASE